MCSSIPSSQELNDSSLLFLAQSGDCDAVTWMPYRFGGMGGNLSSGIVVIAARAACRRIGRKDSESAEEVVSRIYMQLFDHNIARYNPSRGSVSAYLRGLADNAAKGLRGKAVECVPESLEAPNPGKLSLEEKDCLQWVYQTAPRDVQRAFVRLRKGQTLKKAAQTSKVSRRSLKRAIDQHVERCHVIMAVAA